MSLLSSGFPGKILDTTLHLAMCEQEESPFYDAFLPLTKSVVVVTDSGVPPLFQQQTEEEFRRRGISVLVYCAPRGEAMKSLRAAEDLIRFLSTNEIGKDGCLVALGGGALLDAAGFVASIYGRGMLFGSIPTTLLALVDASVGGKTGLNVAGTKNVVGTFYPPLHLLITPKYLASLPRDQLRSGLAEVIKYAALFNKELFFHLEGLDETIDLRDPSGALPLIGASLSVKKRIVEQDPKDRGIRNLLNFGHTVGHAIEGLARGEILHGHAVAAGMVIEGFLSRKAGFLTEEELLRLIRLIQKQHLLPSLPFSYERLRPFLLADKKNVGSEIKVIFLRGIGGVDEATGSTCRTVSEQDLREAVDRYQEIL